MAIASPRQDWRLLLVALAVALLFWLAAPAARAEEPEGLLALTVTQQDDAARWAFNGWAAAGWSFAEPAGREADSADEVFSHSLAIVQNPDFDLGDMLAPFATETYAMTLGDRGFVQVTQFLTLGEGTDSWAGWLAYRESQPEQTAGGIVYWLDAFVDVNETRYKPINVRAGMNEDGGVVAEAVGWWPISGGHPLSYMVLGRMHYEQDGDSYMDVSFRHHTSADLSSFVEVTGYNLEDDWGVSVNLGTAF